jgi:U3 small nucleolar RNA-associated protein 7
VFYKDISIGDKKAEVKVGVNTTSVCYNPYNAILCLGHINGSLSMVTPRDERHKPAISMLCHKGSINNVACGKLINNKDPTGVYLTTTCVDNTVKVFDIRKTYKAVIETELESIVNKIDISQKGMLAISTNNEIKVYSKLEDIKNKPYLKNKLPGYNFNSSNSIKFCPYEDILGIAHNKGFF